MIKSESIYAIFLLISTVIGVGIFALPYALNKSGYWFLVWLIFWLFGFSFLHYIYTFLLENISPKENFPGILAKGFKIPKLKIIGWLLDLLTYSTTLLIYFLIAGEFLPKIFPFLTFNSGKIVFAILSLLLGILGLTGFAKLESTLAILMIILILFFSGYFLVKSKIVLSLSFGDPLFSYAPLVFAYTGISAVPIIYDLLKDKKKVFKASLISYTIIAFLYFIFAFSSLKFIGPSIEELSLISFSKILPSFLMKIIIYLTIFNILTTAAIFFFYLKRGLKLEILKPKSSSVFSDLLLLFLTIFLVSLPKMRFISLINFLGEIVLGLEFLLILILYYLLEKNKALKILSIFLGVVLIIAFIHGLR
jgi:amino acid permease